MDKRVAVIAVDPGKLTGWALWKTSPEDGVEYASGELPLSDALSWVHNTLSALTNNETGIGAQGLIEIVCESYIITSETHKKSRQYEPLEGIGALRHLCNYYGVPFALQSPRDGKLFGTNEKLHTAGFWFKGGKGHANDAGRHMLLHLARQKYIDLSMFTTHMEEEN